MTQQHAIPMLRMITGYWVSQLVHALAEFAIADHLAKAPASLNELASKTSANEDGMFRLLRAAASLELVGYDGSTQQFFSTPLLDTLRTDAPGSLRGMAIAQATAGHWLPWGRFVEAVRTGSRQSVQALGFEQFEYYAHSPREGAAFTLSMQGSSELVQQEVVRLVDVEGVSTVADLGGANGSLVCALVNANPGLKGIVLELPHVVDSVAAFASERGVPDRVSAIAGDFFECVPTADLYLLKFILHDWDDDSCVKIMTNCARALQPHGRVIIIEMLLGTIGEPGLAPLVDLNMLVLNPGRERTVEEYGRICRRAGLRLRSAVATSSPFSIMEVVAN